MIRSKFAKVVTLGVCLTVFSSGAALAADPDGTAEQGHGQPSLAFENYAPIDVSNDLLENNAKAVEGEQAVLFTTAVAGEVNQFADGIDLEVTSAEDLARYSGIAEDDPVLKEDGDVLKEETMELTKADEQEGEFPLAYAMGGVALLGGTFVAGRYAYTKKAKR